MTYIVRYLTIMLIQGVLIFAFISLAKKKIKINFKMILVIMIYSLIELFLSHYVSIPINGFICVIYFIGLIKWITSLEIKEVCFYILVLWLFGILIDISIMLVLINLFNEFVAQLNSNYVKPISSLFLAFFLLILTNNKYIQHLISNIYSKIKKLNINIFKFVIILAIYLLIDAICIVNISNEYTIIILFINTFLMTYLLYCKYEIFNLKITNNLLIKNNDFYTKVINDYHILKHNLINQLIGLKLVSTKKGKKIIDDLIREYNDSYKSSQNIKDVPNGLSGMIFEKLYNFDCKDINIAIDNKLSENIFNYLLPRSYNKLCEALGIIIDNALEATSVSNDKILYIKFNEEKDFIIVTVINSFVGNIDLENLGSLKYSTKNNGHGYGLFTLFFKRKLNVKTMIRNNLFIIELKVNKK